MHESVIGWFFHKKAINLKWKQILKTHSHKWNRKERSRKNKTIQFSSDVIFPFTTFSWKSLEFSYCELLSFIIEENKAKRNEIERRWSAFEWWEFLVPPENVFMRARDVSWERSLATLSKLQLWLLKKLYTIKSAYLFKACNFLLLSGHHLKWFFSFFVNAVWRRFSRNVYRNVFLLFIGGITLKSELQSTRFFNVNFECEQRQPYLIIRLLDYTSGKNNRTTWNTNRESCTSI